MKKYKLSTNENITLSDGSVVYRIQALKDFSDVKAGDLGGFVESEDNLSQRGNCWIYDMGFVYGDARVIGGARVSGRARIFGDVEIADEFISLYNLCQFDVIASIKDGWIRVGCKVHSFHEWREYIETGSEKYLNHCESQTQHEQCKFAVKAILRRVDLQYKIVGR